MDTLDLCPYLVKNSGKDAVITVSSDRSVRVWMLRDSGQYWPSVCHYLGGGATAVHFNQESRKVFVGLDTGIVAEFEVKDNYTSTICTQKYLDFK